MNQSQELTETPPFAAADVRICRQLQTWGFSPRVIVDIGASNGAWTRQILKVFPDARYELFEPQAESNSVYQGPLRHLLDHHANVRLHTNAIGSADGPGALRLVGVNHVGASMLGAGTGESISIVTRSLDSLIENGDLCPPDLVKMDIQGGELSALRGGVGFALPAATILVLELWLARGYGPTTPLLVEVLDFLKRYDYRPFDFGEEYRDAQGTLITIDVWLCRTTTTLAQTLWGSRR